MTDSDPSDAIDMDASRSKQPKVHIEALEELVREWRKRHETEGMSIVARQTSKVCAEELQEVIEQYE